MTRISSWIDKSTKDEYLAYEMSISISYQLFNLRQQNKTKQNKNERKKLNESYFEMSYYNCILKRDSDSLSYKHYEF